MNLRGFLVSQKILYFHLVFYLDQFTIVTFKLKFGINCKPSSSASNYSFSLKLPDKASYILSGQKYQTQSSLVIGILIYDPNRNVKNYSSHSYFIRYLPFLKLIMALKFKQKQNTAVEYHQPLNDINTIQCVLSCATVS